MLGSLCKIRNVGASAFRAGRRRWMVAAVHALVGAAAVARAQVPKAPAPPMTVTYEVDTTVVKRSGPRYGVLWLSQQSADTISAHYGHKINQTMSIFGWDFETQLLKNPGGTTPMTDLVVVVGGLDQGVILPSATWFVGMRTGDDFEFGVGPNVSLAGAGLALTVGMTHRTGVLNIPFNLAVVSSKLGSRISLSTGFNVMK